MADTASRFPAGTFTPAPGRNSIARILLAQTRMEATLILRHGEQLLLSVFIPLALLVGFTLVPVLDAEDPIRSVYPFTLAVAAMSAGFTGQAIAVGFDRRYGALKRIGASGLPKWAIIAGKTTAVLCVSALQYVLFTVVALALGMRAPVAAFVAAFGIMLLGTVVFTVLGLLMGGTLSAELILALANLIWFVLLGAAALVAVGPELSDAAVTALSVIPSVALTEAIMGVFEGRVAWFCYIVLLVWAVIGAWVAVRYFRFESTDD
ncbi:ABC transporter permease [Corynebacterium sp. 335C]